MFDAMLPHLISYYGNPHSRTHAYGWESEQAVERARKVCVCVCVCVCIIFTLCLWPPQSYSHTLTLASTHTFTLSHPHTYTPSHLHTYTPTHSHTLLPSHSQQVADLIGADHREIVFTSGATEANNMAIKVALTFAPTLPHSHQGSLDLCTPHCHTAIKVAMTFAPLAMTFAPHTAAMLWCPVLVNQNSNVAS